MPDPLWMMLLTCFAILMASPFVLALLLFLVPGRKGKMRTEREFAHDDLPVEQAKPLYAARLAYDGFTIDNGPDPLFLRATRAGAPAGQALTHADKGMIIEMRFLPVGSGVRVHLAAWVTDFVFYDTGESRHIDLTLDRLVKAELERDAVPLVPNRSFLAMSGLTTALLGIATVAFVMFRTTSTEMHMASIVAGGALACLGSLFVAREALAKIRAKPGELRGHVILLATAVLGTLGIIAGAVALYARFSETLIQAFKKELP
jgi:hypothetical protein